MRIKDYLFHASILLNIVLAVIIFNAWQEDPAMKEELYRSEGRVQELEVLLRKKEVEKNALSDVRDSLSVLLKQKPKERVVIIKEYGEKIDNITSLPINSSMEYLTGRLSEVTID